MEFLVLDKEFEFYFFDMGTGNELVSNSMTNNVSGSRIVMLYLIPIGP